VLAKLEVGVKAEVLLDVGRDVGNRFDLGQLEDRLGVVGNGTVAVNGDVDRAHAEEAEGHEAEGEDRRIGPHDLLEAEHAGYIGAGHEGHDQEAHPEGAEVTGHDTGKDRQGRAAFAGRGNDFVNVLRLGAGEDLGELGDQNGGEGTAADDQGQLPPHACVGGELDGFFDAVNAKFLKGIG